MVWFQRFEKAKKFVSGLGMSGKSPTAFYSNEKYFTYSWLVALSRQLGVIPNQSNQRWNFQNSQQVSQQLLLLHKLEAKETASLHRLKRPAQHRKRRLSFCSTATLQSPLIGLVTTLLNIPKNLSWDCHCLFICTRLSTFNFSVLVYQPCVSLISLSLKTDGPTAFIFCLVWVVAKLRCFSIVRYAERCLHFLQL